MEFRVYQKDDGWYWRAGENEWEVGPFPTEAEAEADAREWWFGDVEWEEA